MKTQKHITHISFAVLLSILSINSYAQNMNNTTISRDLSNISPSITNRFQGNIDDANSSANTNIPSNIKRSQSSNGASVPPLVHTQRTQNSNNNQNQTNNNGLPVVKTLDCKTQNQNITPDQMNSLSAQYNNELATFVSRNNLIGVTLDEKENLSQGIISTQFIYSKLPESLKCHSLRILAPNSVTTMDYSLNRINIYVDENKRIIKFAIG